jgi:hypothetical protein
MLTFDPLTYAQRLRAAGVPEAQAEAQAEALRDALTGQLDTLATKADLEALQLTTKADLEALQRQIQTLATKAEMESLRGDIKAIAAQNSMLIRLFWLLLGLAVAIFVKSFF